MESRKITRKWATEDASGRRRIYVEELWESAHQAPAHDAEAAGMDSARLLDERRQQEAAAPLSRWNLAGACLAVLLMGFYACLMLR